MEQKWKICPQHFLRSAQYQSGYGVGRIDFPANKKCHDPVGKPAEKSHNPVGKPHIGPKVKRLSAKCPHVRQVSARCPPDVHDIFYEL